MFFWNADALSLSCEMFHLMKTETFQTFLKIFARPSFKTLSAQKCVMCIIKNDFSANPDSVDYHRSHHSSSVHAYYILDFYNNQVTISC